MVNDRLGLGVSVRWSGFPCFFEWLNLRAGNYAIGLEPSTHHMAGAAVARADGGMIWLRLLGERSHPRDRRSADKP